MKTIAEVSIDTQTLEKRLLAAQIGETVEYRELSALIGRDVTDGARYVLHGALKRLMRDEHMVFSPVRSVGVQRLDDARIAGSGDQTLARIRSLSRRGRARLTCVKDFEALTPELKAKHNVSLSLLGALGHLSQAQTVKKLEAKTSNSRHDTLPVAKFLDAVREGL